MSWARAVGGGWAAALELHGAGCPWFIEARDALAPAAGFRRLALHTARSYSSGWRVGRLALGERDWTHQSPARALRRTVIDAREAGPGPGLRRRYGGLLRVLEAAVADRLTFWAGAVALDATTGDRRNRVRRYTGRAECVASVVAIATAPPT